MSDQAKRHRHEIQVRFADMDMMGHLNNACCATYSEAARIAFLVARIGHRVLAFKSLPRDAGDRFQR